MPLSLLLPVGLAALGALLLPLLIHLARRSEHRPTDFAALRWLRAQPRPRHRVRFDERLLLALRLLLLALLALLLARPVIDGQGDTRPQVLLAPGVALDQAQRLDIAEDAQWHWLAPGFPPITTPPPVTAEAQASLLREFDATLPAGTDLHVIVPARWAPLDAQVPQLSRVVRWSSVDGATSPATVPAPRAAPSLLAYADDDRSQALRHLRALQAAWQPQRSTLDVRATASTGELPRDITVVVWLAATPLPAPLQRWLHAGGSLLLARDAPLPDGITLLPRWRDDDGTSLLDAAHVGRGQLLRFTRALDAQAMPQLLDGDVADVLREALQPTPAPTQAIASTHAPGIGATPLPRPATPLTPWLALGIALLFLLERWLAGSPRRWGLR